ncbi:Hint domain-containing protein [Oceaniglobus trochenteri]|uniref:Hint domain-containing protein n=1 Tax=Oceaniglobus trochenteri TaxID=2763260 RepID=UPI001CFFEFD6|nr:Hint domain-containing protein [Oceaniglobus trochenteri]
MGNISGIEGFILRGFYPNSLAGTQQNVSEDFTETVGEELDATGSRVDFNFVDGNNDGQLWDSDDETGPDPTNFTGGDRLNYPDSEFNGQDDVFVVDMVKTTVTITYSDGTTYVATDGFRMYKMLSGDVILNPLDSVVNDPAIRPFSDWSKLTITSVGNNSGNANLRSVDMSTQDDDLPVCFGPDVLIDTDAGPVAARDLAVGDRVWTVDHGFQEIRWIGSTLISSGAMRTSDKHKLVKIAKGALGNDLPRRDMIVTRQHRILVASRAVRRSFRLNEVLVPAVQLLKIPGVTLIAAENDMRVVHFCFDRHEVVLAEGVKTESLFLGPNAIALMSPDMLAELSALFPLLLERGFDIPPARTMAESDRGNLKRLVAAL